MSVPGLHIGTSGWSYDHWERVLYPPGLRPAARLDVYSSQFSTVELNASFYRWPRPATFAGWDRRLPDGFRLCVKAPRGLTHARKLFSPEVWMDRISAGWRALGEHRGLLLVQLPPQLERDDARLDYFLGALPDWIEVAVEFRHPSWLAERSFEVLSRHRAAYVVMSGARLPCVLRATAPAVYVRMHGPDTEHLYAGSYSDADLSWWADRIREWRSGGHEVWVYFNNDGYGHAVRNALTLRGILGD